MDDPFDFNQTRSAEEDTYSELMMAIREIEYTTSRVYGWSVVHRFKEAHEEGIKMARATKEINRALRKMNKLIEEQEVESKKTQRPNANN